MKEITPENLLGLITSKTLEEQYKFIESHMGLLFSTPDLHKIYPILKEIDLSKAVSSMPKLIIAWMAFVCGDHARCYMMMNHIEEEALECPNEKSLFYSLKSFLLTMMDIKEAIRYAKKSIDVLSKEKDSIFLANAYLTYGQICSGTDQYSDAVEMFEKAYKIFFSLDLGFLAVIAFVNQALNMFKIGEYTLVMKKCHETLYVFESFNNETPQYLNIINLPLGLCYYELCKFNNSLKYLKSAKEAIDSLELFHMYGMTEIYLFKTYYILNDTKGMASIKNDYHEKFGQLKSTVMDMLNILFTVYTSTDSMEIKPTIEQLEMEYLRGNHNSFLGVIELLVYLKIQGLSHLVTIEDLKRHLEHNLRIGNISSIQLTLIQLSELALRDEKETLAIDYMKEAIKLYKQYGNSANFYLLPLKSLRIIKKLDEKLFNELSNNGKTHINVRRLLSEREIEILNLAAQGKTNDEISKLLFISVGTIKWHMNNIFSKLDVKNRIQAIEKAKQINEI